MEKILVRLRSTVLYILLFLFPLFFLSVTQEFFFTNKLYLLTFGVLLLFLISTIKFFVTKKITWETRPLDISIVLSVVTIILSIVFVSPNKIQAILNSNFGLLEMVVLTILYFYLSREKNQKIFWVALKSSAVALSFVTILFFLQVFKFLPLPQGLEYLKSPLFTTLGSPLDLTIYLGIFSLIFVIHFILNSRSRKKISERIIPIVSSLIVLVAFFITLYSILKSVLVPSAGQIGTPLPPFNISWYAAVEILKNPLNALFGVGVDNFSSIFTRIKDVGYNLSPIWQINAFSVSRSTLLHIYTETGLFGLIALALIIGTLSKLIFHSRAHFHDINILKPIVFVVAVVISIILFPPSLPLFFLFFVGLSFISQLAHPERQSELNLSHLVPVCVGIGIVFILIIGVSGYFVGRSYAAELYFKKSINAITKNNIKDLYDNQRQTIIVNPYIERFRINFSQTNLLIANNIASKANQPISQPTNQPSSKSPLSEQDRQTISQAIQASIAEAKAVVGLNPQKAGNWENLALIYRNILNVAQGADTWAISSYQRAIILDPQNPIYRLNLGGVYYSLNNWDEAYSSFAQAVGLKSNWANAYYNLAWASYQKGSYQLAVNAMQSTINLLDVNAAKTDYERAQSELAEFKKKLPNTTQPEVPASKEATLNKQTPLVLPKAAPTIEPKIKLPKNVSPETN